MFDCDPVTSENFFNKRKIHVKNSKQRNAKVNETQKAFSKIKRKLELVELF